MGSPTRKSKRTGVAAAAVDPRTGDGAPASDDAVAALSELQAGTQISIRRTVPTYASGWLAHLEVTDDADSVLDTIQREWGGGTYLLQFKERGPSGRLHYVKGSVRLQIAGPSKYRGDVYAPDGTVQTRARDVTPPASPVVVHNPSPPSQDRLWDIVQRAIDGSEKGGKQLDVVSLVQALQSQLGSASPDPFGQLERTLGLVSTLRKTFQDGGGGGGGGSDDDDDEGMFSSKKMMNLLMMKMLGGGGGGPPMGAVPPGHFGGGQPPSSAAPPGHVFHPQRGWIPDPSVATSGKVFHPQRGWIPYPGPTQPTPQPTQPTPSSGPLTPAEPVDADGTEANPEEVEYEPLTASEILEDLRSRSPADRDALVTELIAGLGGADPAEVRSTLDAAATAAGGGGLYPVHLPGDGDGT